MLTLRPHYLCIMSKGRRPTRVNDGVFLATMVFYCVVAMLMSLTILMATAVELKELT
jgi:hypothetical protein